MAKAFKRPIVIGDGSAILNTVRLRPIRSCSSRSSDDPTQVHIDDLVDLFLLVLDHAFSGKDEGVSPYAKMYIAVSREITQREMAEETTKVLYAKGVLATDKLEQISLQEATKLHPMSL